MNKSTEQLIRFALAVLAADDQCVRGVTKGRVTEFRRALRIMLLRLGDPNNNRRSEDFIDEIERSIFGGSLDEPGTFPPRSS